MSTTQSTWWGGNNYSLEEQVIGTWIDGKPLYQKTYSCGALPNTGIKQIDLQIQNLKAILDIRGIAIGGSTPSDASYMFPMTWLNINDSTNSSLITVYYSGGTTKKLIIGVGQDRSNVGVSYVTILYTKTTD